MIDIHVHLRDYEESHKETIAHGLSVASSVGYSALFEMPNTQPPLTTRMAVERRLAFADQVLMGDRMPVYHGLYGGVTADHSQLQEMLDCCSELFPRMVGLKMYAGPSTGELGITEEKDQQQVYRYLARSSYQGVLALHCEDAHLFKGDENLPHGEKRPLEAELSSIKRQLSLAKQEGFSGTLHICHVTSSQSLELIAQARPDMPCRVTAGVTPHHLLLNDSLAAGDDGYLYTVNPPLRAEEVRSGLFQSVLAEQADVLESDHAPHELSDKRSGASGLPGIPGMLCAAAYLVKEGIDGSLLMRMIFENPMSILGLEPEMLIAYGKGDDEQHLTALYRITDMFDQITTGGWNSLCSKYQQAVHEYPWDPYRSLAEDYFSRS